MRINPLLESSSAELYLSPLKLSLSNSIIEKFKNIKFVCLHGSYFRAFEFAKKVAGEIYKIDQTYFDPINLSNSSNFKCYVIGSVLSISHGMGNPSILTILDNVSKIMYKAKNFDVKYIRLGTSGGLGVPAGTVIITESAYRTDLKKGFELFPLGKRVMYDTDMNQSLNKEIIQSQPEKLNFDLYIGNTIAADDFYQAQARTDGIINPNFNQEEKFLYFKKIRDLKIINFEMESTALASFCLRAEIPATMVTSTIINRMESDQPMATKEQMIGYINNSQSVVINYLKNQLN